MNVMSVSLKKAELEGVAEKMERQGFLYKDGEVTFEEERIVCFLSFHR
jgi:hypothetical protein